MHKAEQAYVRQKTVKCTVNCIFSGRGLAEKIHICKINAQGNDEITASQCWDEKARTCTLFELVKQPENLKKEFRSLSLQDISLRWPSIGELLWVKSNIQKLMSKENENDDGRTISK